MKPQSISDLRGSNERAGNVCKDRKGATNPFSFDQRGKLFICDGEIHRQLVPELYETYRRLQAEGRLEKLFESGLIRTWSVGDESDRAVAHENLPFVTYPQEWTVHMLKTATLCVLDIAILLNDADLSLQDPHPWNVTFHHGRPVYYDFSSIFEGKRLHARFINDLFKSSYLPVWLSSRRFMAERSRQLSRAVMNCEHEWRLWKQPRAEWRRLFDRGLLGRLCFKFWNIVRRHYDQNDPGKMLRVLRDHIAGINVPRQKTMWGEYNDPGGDFNDPSTFSPKAQAVVTLLDPLKPGRLLDLACNRGWFTGYAVKLGHTAMGVDVDENAVDAALPRAQEWGFDIGQMNVVWPTPPQGAFLMYPSAYERLSAETVLMIALQHHLVLRQNIRFDALGATAARFGAKNLIIEWTPKDDVVVQHWLKTGKLRHVPDWYTEKQFVAAIKRYFPNATKVPSGAGHEDFPGPTNRSMFLFQR